MTYDQGLAKVSEKTNIRLQNKGNMVFKMGPNVPQHKLPKQRMPLQGGRNVAPIKSFWHIMLKSVNLSVTQRMFGWFHVKYMHKYIMYIHYVYRFVLNPPPLGLWDSKLSLVQIVLILMYLWCSELSTNQWQSLPINGNSWQSMAINQYQSISIFLTQH